MYVDDSQERWTLRLMSVVETNFVTSIVYAVSITFGLTAAYGLLTANYAYNAVPLIAICCAAAMVMRGIAIASTTWKLMLLHFLVCPTLAFMGLWFGKIWGIAGWDVAVAVESFRSGPFGVLGDAYDITRNSQFEAVFDGYVVDEPRNYVSWIIHIGEVGIFTLVTLFGVGLGSDYHADGEKNLADRRAALRRRDAADRRTKAERKRDERAERRASAKRQAAMMAEQMDDE